jgi:hypothetical protein
VFAIVSDFVCSGSALSDKDIRFLMLNGLCVTEWYVTSVDIEKAHFVLILLASRVAQSLILIHNVDKLIVVYCQCLGRCYRLYFGPRYCATQSIKQWLVALPSRPKAPPCDWQCPGYKYH